MSAKRRDGVLAVSRLHPSVRNKATLGSGLRNGEFLKTEERAIGREWALKYSQKRRESQDTTQRALKREKDRSELGQSIGQLSQPRQRASKRRRRGGLYKKITIKKNKSWDEKDV